MAKEETPEITVNEPQVQPKTYKKVDVENSQLLGQYNIAVTLLTNPRFSPETKTIIKGYLFPIIKALEERGFTINTTQEYETWKATAIKPIPA
jgi:hypothetical protein